MSKREKVPVQYKLGMRKTPSEDVSVIPDRDTSSMPVDASLIFKADGNEGKLIMSVGRYNSDQKIPAIHFGLSRDRKGTTESRGLTEIQARFAATMLSKTSLNGLGIANGSAWNGLNPLVEHRGYIFKQSDNIYRSYPVDFGTSDQSGPETVGLVNEHRFAGSKSPRNSSSFSGANLTTAIFEDPRNQLGYEIGGVSLVSHDNRTRAELKPNGYMSVTTPMLEVTPAVLDGSGNVTAPAVMETPRQAVDRMHEVSPTSWHTRFAEAKIQTRGDYIRSNRTVLRDLLANMHQYQEYESTGLFARGFRSNLWSRRSDDEIRVLGQLMHLGECLARGYPIVNRHLKADLDDDPDLTVTSSTYQSIVRVGFPFDESGSETKHLISRDDVIAEMVSRYNLDATQEADLDAAAQGISGKKGVLTITFTAVDPDVGAHAWENVGNSNTPGVHFDVEQVGASTDADYSGTSDWILNGAVNLGYGDSDTPTIINKKYDSKAEFDAGVDALNGKVDDRRAEFSTHAGSAYVNPASFTGIAGIEDQFIDMVQMSVEASVNPFFVAINKSNYGPMRMDLDHELNENRPAGIHTDGFFACVPGLENHLSLAHVVEGELVQPDSRDFKFESFWNGLAWLFESDSSEPVGRHWGSASKFIRTLSPDFKSGAVHDFRSNGARTNPEVMKAAYLLGHTKIDDIKARDADPVTADGFFTRTSSSVTDQVTLIDLYEKRNFINEANRAEFVSQIDDMALRNIQTTNDFIRGQQAVGEASTSVYHRQSPDGGEYTVNLDASLMSFGAFDFLAPSIVMADGTRVGLFRNRITLEGSAPSTQSYLNVWVPDHFPRTMDWGLINHDAGFDYNILTPTFVRFDWSASWEGLRSLCKMTNPGAGNWWNAANVFTPVSSPRVVSLTKNAATNIPSTIGEYFIDLTISNPIYRFMELTSDVYRSARTNVGAAPYQSKINFSDLIDINLIKQVTLSTGSPALQQLLNSMMTYALRHENFGGSFAYTLKRLSLMRHLWDRNLHPRDAPYTRQELPLVPLVMLDDTGLEDIPSLISNTNIFLHDLGYAGYVNIDEGPSLTSGMVRTLYTNSVSKDGTVNDYAFTKPGESFDYSILGNADNEHTLVSSVKPSASLTHLSGFMPGFRHHSIYTQQSTSQEQSSPYCWAPDFASSSPRASLLMKETSGGKTVKPERFVLDLRPNFLETTLRLPRSNKFREMPTEIAPTFYFKYNGAQLTLVEATTAGSINSGDTLVTAYAMIDGEEVQIKADPATSGKFITTGKIRQIPDRVQFYSSRNVASGHVALGSTLETADALEVVFPELTTFDVDVIGAISGVSRVTVDEALFYHSRKPRFAFICPDVFDVPMQIYSQCLHHESGQRLVGPMSYAIMYDSSGNIVSSLREVYSVVGSGEQLKGTPAASSASTDVAASDGDEPAEVQSNDDYSDDDDN